MKEINILDSKGNPILEDDNLTPLVVRIEGSSVEYLIELGRTLSDQTTLSVDEYLSVGFNQMMHEYMKRTPIK